MNSSSRTLFASVFALILTAAAAFAQQALPFDRIVVFGDSLSDTGNVRARMEDKFQIKYPGGEYNYSDGRFTNSKDTNPGSASYVGVWHEQLARTFLNLSAATNSLAGGYNYAFGGATTESGTRDITVFSNPDPFSGGDTTVTVDNLGKQVSDYLVDRGTDASALYIVWGGGNDLFNDRSDANVTATAERMAALVLKLAHAGAKNFLVPNVPALGLVPKYRDNPTRANVLNVDSANYRTRLNQNLDAAVATLASEGITINLYRLDVYQLFLRLAANPENYGFVNARTPAQGQSVDPDKFLFWDDIHPTTAGHYRIAQEAYRVLSGNAQPLAKSVNVSTRSQIGTDENVLIGGVIVNDAPKKVVFRAIGPSLNVNGQPVPGRMADPVLELYQQGQSTPIATNDNWKDSPQQAEIAAAGLAPTNDLESAILQTLAPGNYTAIVRGKNNTTGIGLVEAFDVDSGSSSSLGNISSRALVQTGDNVLIGGFIVGSGDPATIVVRGIGPSLAASNIANPLLDPTIDLYDANGAVLATNDNWKDKQQGVISAVGLAPTDDREAAIMASLAPGNYTAIVRGKNDTTGVALVEAYNVR